MNYNGEGTATPSHFLMEINSQSRMLSRDVHDEVLCGGWQYKSVTGNAAWQDSRRQVLFLSMFWEEIWNPPAGDGSRHPAGKQLILLASERGPVNSDDQRQGYRTAPFRGTNPGVQGVCTRIA